MDLCTEMACCGITEIQGLSDHRNSEEALKEFCRIAGGYDWEWRFRFAVFTEAGGKKSTYGKNFARYIEKHGLGEVVATKTKVNPNSGNPLKAFVWTMNIPALKSWAKENGVSPEDRDPYWY